MNRTSFMIWKGPISPQQAQFIMCGVLLKEFYLVAGIHSQQIILTHLICEGVQGWRNWLSKVWWSFRFPEVQSKTWAECQNEKALILSV